MPSPSRHKVFARTVAGDMVSHPSLAFTSYRQAIAVWTVLDDARRAGRLPLVKHLEVRLETDPDPRYAYALTDLAPFFVGRLRGTTRFEDAVKRAAQGKFVGEVGGWIYRADQSLGKGRPQCQGWASLEARMGYRSKGWVVEAYAARLSPRVLGDRGIRYYVNDLRTIDADAVLGPQHETVDA